MASIPNLESSRQKKSLFRILVNYLHKVHVLKKKNKELIEQNEAQNKIISILAHDVRNPLTSIKNIIELKQSDVLDTEDASLMMKKVTVQLNSTLELVDNIVTWGQAQLNTGEIETAKFNLYDVAERILNSELLHSTEKNNIIVNAVNRETLVEADEHSLEFVMRNLVGNANKFTTEGLITISADVSGKNFTLSISDTGVGMTQLQMEKLFKADLHVTSLGTNNEKGSGMGLVLVKELVEKMDGTIKVESEQGTGSTFKLEFLRH